MYEDLFKNLPEGFDLDELGKAYWNRLYYAIDDAVHHSESNNTDGALMMLGAIREIADAYHEIRKTLDSK